MIITSKKRSVNIPVNLQLVDPNSWQLNVNVIISELGTIEERSLRVHGDTHIGGVIYQLVEGLPVNRHDWSGFALWWPQQNRWLTRTKQTLDQCGVQADARLQFIRTHRSLKIQLPDLQVISLSVDFSSTLFKCMKQICKGLGVRHADEVSLLRASCLDSQRLVGMATDLDGTGGGLSDTSTINSSSVRQSENSVGETEVSCEGLMLSPHVGVHQQLVRHCVKYKSVGDKARVNSSWLDSSKSLMEQTIGEQDLVQLRFKYYAFFDLNAKLDAVRINQIYEQAKWSILSEEIDATEQELVNFAALQLHTQLQTKSWTNGVNYEESEIISHSLIETSRKQAVIYDEDDVDTALSKLEQCLDGVQVSEETIKTEHIELTTQKSHPKAKDFKLELADELLLHKQAKLSFKKFKPFYFVLDVACYLSYFKSREDSVNGRPIDKILLKGCELLPDVNVSQRKFGMSLKVHSQNGMNEICLRCPSEECYARWLSACKLASSNKTISEQAFSNETKSILNLLQLQQSKLGGCGDLDTTRGTMDRSMSLKSGDSRFSQVDNENTQANNLMPLRMSKKYKIKQLNDKILEAYSGISHLDLNESKWHYIRAWQALPAYGITYFTVKMKGSRHKEEIIGVTSNRLLQMSTDGETLKTWRFNTMKSWNVNWESKQFEVIFDEEFVVFTCVHCEARILHEFIGAYIYLSMRTPGKSMPLDDDMFFQLTEKR